VTWAAAWTLLRRFWWAVPMIGLLAALHITRTTLADRTSTLRTERAAWSAEIAKAEQLRIEAEKRFATQQTSALTTYADRLAAREPIILRSTNTVRTYAQTDAGRVLCRDVDRVRAIDDLDGQLAEPSSAASGSAGGVPSDAATPTSER